MSQLNYRRVFDNIHGYIQLTRAEQRVMETAYYQRLRWIRQLGFTFYVYPGATHTRFAHALGVMHVMDKLLYSIGKGVSEHRLYNPRIHDKDTMFHRSMRMSAMLHDIGTFPFSHTVELAYINHWKKQRAHGKGRFPANHETLGSHIILNTDFPGGITHILLDEGYDPQEIADVVAGKSKNPLANQLLHSDLDADRMDYLLRDAHHTGVKLGLFDLQILIGNMVCESFNGKEILCIKEDAINWVEYFLMCRYSWYSQIINDGTGYKFDLLAATIYEYFLENGLAYSFDQLIQQVSQNPHEYFTFNDSYYMSKLHEYLAGRITHPVIRELSEMLAQRVAPKQIKIPPVEPTLVQSAKHRQELIREVQQSMNWLREKLTEINPSAWMITDIPSKDVMFTKNHDTIRTESGSNSGLSLRDPVKVLGRNNEPKLLIDVSNSIMKILSQYRNFIPRIYVSNESYNQLRQRGLLDEMQRLGKKIISA
jgi:HD superfamily phosphohydrolase